ncbi:MAG: hypothetical protein HWN68_02275 [Desulfobacterales bacterium]|nr:hypothetical protein [Desulfobacterales bacterium]
MKTVKIDGKKYKIRVLPIDLAPEVFDAVQQMHQVAEKVTKDACEPQPENDQAKLKLLMEIFSYTQEKLSQTKFFRQLPESVASQGSGTGDNSAQKAVRTAKAGRK